MRGFAYPVLLTATAMIGTTPVLAQDSVPFTGARVEGQLGYDDVRVDGRNLRSGRTAV